MRLSLLRFYWLRLIGAVVTLSLALCYLNGYEEVSLFGFIFLAILTAYITVRISKNTMPASCDLCSSPSTMTAEYGAGYANARLILNCPRCGRVVNGKPGSMQPQRE